MPDPKSPPLDDLLEHAGFVRGLARAILRHEDLAEDVSQETWLAALQSGPHERKTSRPWLSGVVRNLAYGVLRRQGRRARRERAAARPEAVPASADQAAQVELLEHVARAVAALREPYRTVVLLRHYEGLPPRRIAARLAVPVETVRTRLKRALAQLRSDLDPGDDERRRTRGAALLALAGPAMPAGLAGGAMLGWGAAALLLAVVATWWAWPPDSTVAHPDASSASTEAVPVLLGSAKSPARHPAGESGRSVLFGTVFRAGAPVPARVELRPGRGDWFVPSPAGGEPMATAMAGADGRFELPRIVPGRYEVRALVTRADPLLARAFVLADGEHQRLDLTLPPSTRTVRGVIRWKSGRPFQGHVQHAHTKNMTSVVHTSAEGHFEIRVPRGEAFRLVAQAEGRIRVAAGFHEEAGSGEPLTWILDEGLVRYEGRAVSADTGAPIAGALVSYLENAGKEAAFRSVWTWARTDADGRFSTLVFPGTHPRVEAAGHLARHGRELEEDGVFGLPRTARIEGTLRDADGAIVTEPSTVVGVTLAERSTRAHEVRKVATDAAGRFALDVVPGHVFLYAHGPGHASSGLAALRKGAAVEGAFDAAPGRRLQRDLEVEPTAVLLGRVVDEGGEPIVGALVTVETAEPSLHRGVRDLRVYAATDETGAFVALGVVPGLRVRAVATHPSFARARSVPIALDSGMAARVTLTLQRTRAATILVLDDQTDRPVADAEVTLRAARPAWGYELQGPRARTDTEGRAHIRDAPPGPCGVVVNARGYMRDDNPHALAPSRSDGDFEATVRLTPEMQIAGRVRGPEGVEIAKVRVALIPTGETRRHGVYFPGGRVVEPDGSFRFNGKETGTYRVEAWLVQDGVRYEAQADVAEDGAELDLLLTDERRAGAWRVRVFDPVGRPTGAWVARIGARSGYVEWARADGGVAAFDALPSPAGEMYLFVMPGPSPEDAVAPGCAVLGPVADTGGEFEVRLEPGRTVRGVLLQADGRPAAGLGLKVRPVLPGVKPNWSQHRSERETRTDAEGRFLLDGLGTMAYRVEFQSRADGWTPGPATFGADEDAPALRLEPPPESIALRIEDPGGRPAPGAYVRVLDGSGAGRPVASGTASAGGVVHLTGLDPAGRYRLLAGSFGPAPAVYESGDWSPANARVRLVACQETSGEVRDPQGRVLVHVRVYRRTVAGTWTMLQEHPTHPWRGWLPPGRHLLRAVPMEAGAPTPGAEDGTWVEAGAQGVQITFDPGPSIRLRLEGWPAGEGATVYLATQGAPDERVRLGSFRAGEAVQFHGLDAARHYVVWASPDAPDEGEERGLCAFAEDLSADAKERPVVVEDAAPLHGLVHLPEGVQAAAVRVYARVRGIRVPGRVQSDGGFRIPGVPHGSWPVVFEIHRRAGMQRFEVRGASGAMDVRVP